MFKILHYSEMECNCVRKFITEELFRNYSTLWQHRCECPLTVLTIVYILAGGPFEPIGKFGTEVHCVIKTESLNNDGQQFHQYQQNKQPSLTSNHWTQKRSQHMVLEIYVQARNRYKKVVVLNRLIGYPPPLVCML